jgi:hypothetical protein
MRAVARKISGTDDHGSVDQAAKGLLVHMLLLLVWNIQDVNLYNDRCATQFQPDPWQSHQWGAVG